MNFQGTLMLRPFHCLVVAASLAGCSAQPTKAPALKQADQSLPSTPMASALPPKYLSVPQFKDCLNTQQISTYRAWCMPSVKPAQCPATSWSQLQALQGSDRVPACSAETSP
jgi:uncharacterized lipoprotein